MITKEDRPFLKRSDELAEEGLNKGDAPFGSVLVSSDGKILFENHNHIGGGDATRHPEFAIARWAAENLSPEERAEAVVYTSGEHCSMCSSAHGLVGLGRNVYVSSTEQLKAWKKEWGVDKGRLKGLAIEEVIKDTQVDGPDEELSEKVKQLQARYYNLG
ncbi:nucleoside deaminase [Alkalibacterium kapii]|uniref:tRNA-specific adenosine deaminase n=1 Tax=Alkalibacterium kapii TaxID=426704 RepID=A0A511ATR4_9LACT|nr:nucleoside deaminase [Alkalibacterium kapii]GEK91578.1 tRNA-specific adenosine deaminase [Alkalibacterium kapii]